MGLKNWASRMILKAAGINPVMMGLYANLFPGIDIKTDTSMSDYVKTGYSKNLSIFAIVNKIITMSASVPYKRFKGDEETEEDPIKYLFQDTATDFSYYEFRKMWNAFGLVTGNSIVYCPRLQGGNNKGMPMSFDLMPTQHTTIESGGFGNPVKSYHLKFKKEIPISPEDVWHTRLFPDLEYEQGSNFMGAPPVKVAINKAEAQNNSDVILKNTFARGMPPGIVFNEYIKDPVTSKQFIKLLEDAWDEKYGTASQSGKPIVSNGKLGYLKLGFDTLKDLMIIENSQQATRELCNLWGLPSELFNDPAGSTYNNATIAGKQIYTHRIKPDLKQYYDGLNLITIPAFGIRYEPDYSDIDELQDDKEKKSKWVIPLVQQKIISRDEARIVMGWEETGLDDMQLENMLLESSTNENLLNEALKGIEDYK